MLRNVAEIDLSTSVLGQRVSMPICVGATAMQCMAHVDGELATVRGRKKVLTQKDRRALTFSDSFLCMHQANTSLDMFILTKAKLIDSAINIPVFEPSAPLFSSCMTLGKILVPQFYQLQDRDKNSTHLLKLLSGLNEFAQTKHLK